MSNGGERAKILQLRPGVEERAHLTISTFRIAADLSALVQITRMRGAAAKGAEILNLIGRQRGIGCTGTHTDSDQSRHTPTRTTCVFRIFHVVPPLRRFDVSGDEH